MQASEFFVVVGPVQAGRPCYVERSADQDLIQAIVDQRFAYVLASRGSGKSSLMIRAARTLRQEGYLAAVIDLSQIGARGEGSDVSRWFYSIAHRITRELRLKVDLQSWWQERSALGSEQRFADFFWEIVLTHTKSPVAVFIDEVECAAELPFGVELFAVIRDCYSLRVSEPDFARLGFVVLGVASPSRLCPDLNSSPFVLGDSIGLSDFSLDECYRLAPGFELGEDTGRGLMDRIYGWTSGQPYMTQKISRAVARRGGRLEDVERAVYELFLSPSALQEEPLLSYMRNMLTARAPTTRAALQMLAKLARGAIISSDSSVAPQEALQLAGVVRSDERANLVIKNRVFREVFGEKWAKSAMPFNWRGTGVAALFAMLAVVLPYWYMTQLPRPYIDTLADASISFEESQDAYAKLHRLPGFTDTANALFADVLARHSRASTTLAEVRAVDAILRELGGFAELSSQLMGEFWLRRSQQSIDDEDRDAALVYAIEALSGRPDPAAKLASHLIGSDYERLQMSIRLAETPQRWAVDWDQRRVTIVDPFDRTRTISLDGSAVTGTTTSSDLPGNALTALQLVPLIRELSVDRDGSAGAFDLQMTIEHPVANELTVTLAAPSGTAVTLPLNETHRTSTGFTLTSRSPLELDILADEQRQGVWRLTIVDGQAGNSGTLHRWTLQFDDIAETWFGAPEQGTAITDPIRTDEVDIELSADGSLAVARTARDAAVGALSVWELSSGTLNADLSLEQSPSFVEFTTITGGLLAVGGNTLRVWDADGNTMANLKTQTGFVLPPTVSAEGGYVAIAERVDGAPPLLSLIRTNDGELVASIEGVEGVERWALAPEARYLALLTGSRQILIMDPRRGDIVAELTLDRPPAEVIPIAGDDLLLTVDAVGEVRAWRFAVTPDGLAQLEDWRLGTTVDAASISIAADASTVAFATTAGHVAVHDLARRGAPLLLRAARPEEAIETRLAPDASALLTRNGSLVRLWDIENRPLDLATDPQLAALAIGEEGRIVAMGYRGGYVRAESLSALAQPSELPEVIDFIGHRGAVSAITLNTGQNLIATGGNDGTVRVWNLASVSPSESLMRHDTGPIVDIAISADGRWLASAAASSARVWRVADGEMVTEYVVNGTALAVEFSADAGLFAAGDSAGNLFVGAPGGEAPEYSSRADSAISSIAFSRDSRLIATGDDLGNVRLSEVAAAGDSPRTIQFRQAVRWLSFEPGDRSLLVQTDQWIHRLSISDSAIAVQDSRLLPVNLEPGAAHIGAAGGSSRFVGGVDVGRVAVEEIDFDDSIQDSELVKEPPTLYRDWAATLGYRVDADGVALPLTR